MNMPWEPVLSALQVVRGMGIMKETKGKAQARCLRAMKNMEMYDEPKL